MNSKPSIRFFLAAVLSLGLAIMLGALSPAVWAQGLAVKIDEVKINFGTADFGDGLHIAGSPERGTPVFWEFSTVNGSLHAQATVSGILFLDSLDPGCARLTIEFKSSSGAILATRTKKVCLTVTGHNATH